MVANRVKGIRSAVCWNAESARLARQHNDANVISLGQRMMSREETLEIVRMWLGTPFDGGRHLRRIQLIDEPGDSDAEFSQPPEGRKNRDSVALFGLDHMVAQDPGAAALRACAWLPSATALRLEERLRLEHGGQQAKH